MTESFHLRVAASISGCKQWYFPVELGSISEYFQAISGKGHPKGFLTCHTLKCKVAKLQQIPLAQPNTLTTDIKATA